MGLPGSGKTTVMAEFIKRLLDKEKEEEDLVVFFHVVASSPQSFSIENLLTRGYKEAPKAKNTGVACGAKAKGRPTRARPNCNWSRLKALPTCSLSGN